MSSSPIHVALRGGQACHSIIVLALSSYIAYENKRSLSQTSTEINYLIFASAFSIVTLISLGIAPRLSSRGETSWATLCVQGLVTLLYMTGFIALSVALSRYSSCAGSVCNAARADAVFAALSYAVWAASTTMSGIQITNAIRREENAAKNLNEKLVVEV